ncbi:reprolysin-like metallopeptidase [Chamaesiphon sp. VAR_48_metabat_135_sub]|uniref:M10 family metallopeptidase n=1 Tax=Chamaesiphon sp. VAR_48_metabat_135_sub TaxID=2964699 RepID=UPI00286A6EEA|nr:M10 family metallopeptidase C-terminal domain-containing protein [Chamaesiphon sp. VAR_48_metabat_135_sub]
MFNVFTETTNTTASHNNNIDGLLEQYRWTSKSVSYSFTDSFLNDYEFGYTGDLIHSSSFKTLNVKQRSAMRNWARAYSDISLLNLYEETGTNDRNATIRIAISNEPSTASAYSPGDPVESGDIFLNPRDYNDPGIGNYASYTFAHELGHSLGLKHAHETGGVRNVTMNADRDSMEFSVMSYRSYIGAPLTATTNETWGYAQSLMMYDIRAIQHNYGANFSTNASNTTYTFSTTTGEMFVNGVGQGIPGANRIFRTIWDGNGTDTYNFSNYSTNLAIDLTPGGWSDLNVGGNAQRANLGEGRYARGHVFNALQYNNDGRSLIENAYGGGGNDRIIGNSASNALIGNGGNDYIQGGEGRDYQDGGSGIDTVDYSDWNGGGSYNLATTNASLQGLYTEKIHNFENIITGAGNDTITGSTANNRIETGAGNDTVDGGAGNDIIYLGAGNDTVNITSVGNDIFYGGAGNDNISGWSGNEEYYGQDGNDRLYGYGGNDYLSGGTGMDTLCGGMGNDILTGGVGADRFHFNSKNEGIDRVTDFATDDKIGILASGFGGGLVAGAISANRFLTVNSDFAATSSSQRFIYNSTNGGLYFDIDGTGAGAAVQFATLSSRPTLTATSFVIV